MIHKLPLFPLNTVLFPGAPLPLHIFEERYRLMIGRCIEQQAPFGVVLIRERGRADTDPTVSFHEIGTSAQIGEGVRLEDGRYYLVATGVRRFRVQYLTQRMPYLIASVAYLSEETSPDAVGLASELRALYTRYWAAMQASTGYHAEIETPPDDVVDFTYWLAHRFQTEVLQKQRWLEADVATRLREMGAAMRAEIALLPSEGDAPNEGDWIGPGSWN
jgi:Lon protease-like protein